MPQAVLASAVIPARLHSTRLPGKVLADLDGHPLLWHVWQRVSQVQSLAAVYIVTDAPEVQEAAQSWGAQVLMTSPACRSGTERIATVLDQLAGELILNVQGDEPFIAPDLLAGLVARWQAVPCDLVTPVYRLAHLEELLNPNRVKVVRAHDGRALYFSRSPVPYQRDVPQAQWLENQPYWGHIGVYGYRRAVLADYPTLPASPLEDAERLEQLRFLEAGYVFQTITTGYQSIAVDTPQDLERVRQMLAARSDEAKTRDNA